MNRKSGMIMAVGLGLLATAPAFAGEAVGLNVDFGSAFGGRPTTYGAAAGQVGAWTEVANVVMDLPVVLGGLDGGGSGMTLTSDSTITGFSAPNPGPTGDDATLMNDAFNLGGPGLARTLTFAGLENGTYTVYTYAWAPDNPTYLTNVSVPGSADPGQDIGGTWAGFVQGTTHAVHVVAVTDGTLAVVVEPVADGFGSLNGIQITPGGTLPTCTADFTSSASPGVPDGIVGFADLLAVVSDWGPCPGCFTDIAGVDGPDGVTGFADLLTVISAWGPCP